MKCYEIVKETIKVVDIERDETWNELFDIVTESTKEVVFRSSVTFADEHMTDAEHTEAMLECDHEYDARGYNYYTGHDYEHALNKIGDTYTYYYQTVSDA